MNNRGDATGGTTSTEEQSNRAQGGPSDIPPHLLAAAQAQAARENQERHHDAATLKNAITQWEALLADPAFAAAPADFRAGILNSTGLALYRQYQALGQETDLERAMAKWREAVPLTPVQSPNRPKRLNSLANGLTLLYRRHGRVEDLKEAVECYRQALAFTPRHSPVRLSLLYNFSSALTDLYARTSAIEQLEEAIALFREALELAAKDSSEWPNLLDRLSDALKELWSRTGRLEVLQEGVGTRRELILDSQDFPARWGWLFKLSNDLIELYHRSRYPEHLDEAIQRLVEALDSVPVNSPERPALLSILAGRLGEKYRDFGCPEDLDRSVSLLRQADLAHVDAQAYPARSDMRTQRALVLADLANRLRDRYLNAGNPDDLKEAIRFYRQAVELTDENHPQRPWFVDSLALGLRSVYTRSGRLQDLEEAINLWRPLLDISRSEKRPNVLLNLAEGLADRYIHTGRLEDFEEAVTLWREALSLTSEDSPERPIVLSSFGAGLRSLYKRFGRIEDLEKAVALHREAVDLTPENAAERPRRIDNLANSLGDLYAHTKRPGDLEESITLTRKALILTPEGSPSRPLMLSNLSIGLREQYAHSKRLEELEEAVRHLREALGSVPEYSKHRPALLFNLGSGLRDLYARLKRTEDKEAACKAYREAIHQGLEAHPEIAISSAKVWAQWALQREAWQEAVEASNGGLMAAQRLLHGQILRSHREAWLRESRDLAAIAAYARAWVGDLEGAVEAVENGRAQLLSESLERRRSDLEKLNVIGHGETYERYRRAADLWEEARRQVESGAPAARSRLAECQQVLEEAVDAIRQVTGYKDFLRARSFADISESVREAPFAYLTVSSAGGLALILLPVDSRRVIRVWLHGLTNQSMFEHLFGHNDRLGYLAAYAHKTADPEDPKSRQDWFDVLEQTTAWLWATVMGPLLNALALNAEWPSSKPAPRLTLVPTGWLGILPLHAAWTEKGGRRHYVLDAVTCHYTANARALAVAKSLARQVTPQKLLLVIEPQPVRAAPLPGARREAQRVLAHWPERVTRWHEAATGKDVREQLPSCQVLHYTGHAFAGWEDAEAGGLLLAHDEVLRVKDLRAMHLKLRLAVLSACETGVPGLELPDEVVGLPAALVEAGAAGVVASLWGVPDESTAQLAGRFHVLWREEGLPPPEALRQAQMELRDAGDHLYHWAAFTYTGV